MTEYLFILGRTSDLCRNELEAVLKAKKFNYQTLFSSPEVFHIETETELDVDSLIKILGGTIKIAKVFTVLQKIDEEEIIKNVVRILKRVQDDTTVKKTLNFGFSGYGDIRFNDLNHWSVEVKKNLEESDLKVRFILPKSDLTLSSVVVKKQRLTEIIIVNNSGQARMTNKTIIAKTIAIQDFENWGKRDFGRPCSDSHAGMLPPKVARMMVNLASLKVSKFKSLKFTMLDPFCGVGTILGEAMTMGYEVVGTDMSEAAIQKSQKNLEWLKTNFQFPISNFQLFQCDATHISEKIPAGSIDAIVTEPYLGSSDVMLNSFQHPQRILNQVQNDKVHNIILGLDKLYLGCLREWRKILKPGGMVVMAFPSFKINNCEFFVKKALDSCETLGYTLVGGPYRYYRPQAVVIRNISILTKK